MSALRNAPPRWIFFVLAVLLTVPAVLFSTPAQALYSQADAEAVQKIRELDTALVNIEKLRPDYQIELWRVHRLRTFLKFPYQEVKEKLI